MCSLYYYSYYAAYILIRNIQKKMRLITIVKQLLMDFILQRQRKNVLLSTNYSILFGIFRILNGSLSTKQFYLFQLHSHYLVDIITTNSFIVYLYIFMYIVSYLFVFPPQSIYLLVYLLKNFNTDNNNNFELVYYFFTLKKLHPKQKIFYFSQDFCKFKIENVVQNSKDHIKES
ncbi:hypothetical protein ABPG74_010564 [Tetrahymena malaccensis]